MNEEKPKNDKREKKSERREEEEEEKRSTDKSAGSQAPYKQFSMANMAMM